jgi:hypothetical protein
LCEQTIHQLILAKVNTLAPPPGQPVQGNLLGPPERNTFFNERRYDSLADLLMNLDGYLCRRLFHEWLPELKLLDPACGSGAFLVAAMKTLINIYSAVVGRSEFVGDEDLKRELTALRRAHHGSLNYFIKKRIITDNLFGVDLMEEATEIAKLRLFLALVASIKEREQLEPLPNIDFNIMAGNSLIGLLRVEDNDFIETQPNLFRQSFREIVETRERNIENYRKATTTEKDLTLFRDEIRTGDEGINEILHEILLQQFGKLNIKFEEATWDEEKQKEGKPKKRPVTLKHLQDLKPFHWGYNFSTVLNHNGGFDAIITNPPWEIFKPQAKEFFAEHSELVTKNKMTIKEFEHKQAELIQNEEVRAAWLEYLSRYPHISLYFRNAPQYRNQIAVVNGKKAGTDINLYKLFLEQCFNLLRPGGRCGIIIPSGIYSDLGAKQLREMLFSSAEIGSLFGLSNEKFIFEGVHHAFRFCILDFGKGKETRSFNAAFRVNPREAVASHELDNFLFNRRNRLTVTVDLIRRLSPDSLSVMEFRNETDSNIAEKMLRFPLLGSEVAGAWRVEFCNEFHMTGDSGLFRTAWQKGRLPLCEGKMIHQFNHAWGEPQYWLDEKEAAGVLLATRRRAAKQTAKRLEVEWDENEETLLDYKSYRLAFRDVAASTNERTMIATVLPPGRFCPHTMSLESVYLIRVEKGKLNPNYQSLNHAARLYLCAVLNSFIVDSWLRRSVTNHLSFFFVYGVPVPRLTEQDAAFAPIVARAARLICTAPEFDELAREVGLGDHAAGATNAVERARLRAELDGLVAHLYGLTEDEFAYILTTFPLVAQEVKEAALAAFRAFAPAPDDKMMAKLIADGESDRTEFKVAACWNAATARKDDSMRDNIKQGVAAFLNSAEGGAIIIGVANDGAVIGLAEDYRAANDRKADRDGYQLFLQNLLSSTLGGDVTPYYQITFHRVQGHEVCRIAVQPAPKLVYVNGELYIRDGNQKRKLKTQEAIEYQKHRWGGL